MATGSTLSGFSLTGTLSLLVKSKSIFRPQAPKTHWFWFDEQSCSLKYYRSKDTYLAKVNDPIGCIDLRYAKVTPGIASGYNSKQFVISIKRDSSHQLVYVLTAHSDQQALTWIEKLQEKRSGYIKMSAALEDNAQEQEKERKAFRPPNAQSAGILGSSDVSSSPPTVRKIFSSRLQGEGLGTRQSVDMDVVLNVSPPKVTPIQQEVVTSPLNPEVRQRLELETQYLEARGEADQLKRELMRVSEQLENKNREVVRLNGELAHLKEELAKLRKPQSELALENESLKDVLDQYVRSLKTLDKEINLHRLNQAEHDKRISAEKQKLSEREAELLSVKAKYITLFSDKFKSAISRLGDEEELIDEGSNAELVTLLSQESGSPFRGAGEAFEDKYGDVHDWNSGVTTQLYLCRQLFLHYSLADNDSMAEVWVGYLATAGKGRSKHQLELPPSGDRSKRRELRNLLRKGLPLQFRTKVWSGLIQKVIGKTRDVRDESADKDLTYYKSLLRAHHTSTSEKQIKLDLYRTLPSNVHFQRGGSGAAKLENVLLAYSLHNKNVGYCQGMNMLAAIGLLFLDEETDFWFLVTVIDKLMPPHYFSPGLLAPQADQAVVRELVAEKLPRLHAHLQRYSIDVTLVTFNWFLTLFVDALPTETVLRILDCFLLEGAKVLFRMSLGILKINERKILSLTDPVALFQFLKEVARHTYDIEALFHAAFVELNPFPNRSHLSSRHQHHFIIARKLWNEREKQREVVALLKQPNLPSLSTSREIRCVVWETGCVAEEELWMACSEEQLTHLTIFNTTDKTTQLPMPQAGSRVICMTHLPWCGVVLLGTLDFSIHAVSCSELRHLWSVKLNDSVLALHGDNSHSVFAALADGCVAVLQGVDETAPKEKALLVRIGSSGAVQCIALSNKKAELWCGCKGAVTVVCSENLEVVQSVAIPEHAGKVNKMETGDYGIWISFRKTTLVCLYDAEYYVRLMQVDYCVVLPSWSSMEQHKADQESRVTALLIQGGQLILGTGSGSIHMFNVVAAVPNPAGKVHVLAKQSRTDTLTEFRGRTGSGGLLSSTLELDGQSHYLDRRRRTVFTHTFRKSQRRKGTTSDSDVYKLEHAQSLEMSLAPAEPVRTLLAIREGLVSCVSSPRDWREGIHFWRQEDEQWHCDCLKVTLK